MYITTLSLVAVCAMSSAGDFGRFPGESSYLDIELPSLVDSRDDLTGSPVDPAVFGFDMLIGMDRLSTTAPIRWSEKSEAAVSELEDQLIGHGPSLPDLSNRLTASSRVDTRTSFGSGQNGMQSFDEQFSKTTVIPLPSASLLGAAGLVLVGAGRFSRRR